jgi:alkaline phosphatase D
MGPVTTISRRAFMEMAVAIGATAVWGDSLAARSKVSWRERRDLFPEGVASGDPESDSVLLWTRRAPIGVTAAGKLNVYVGEDELF